MLFSEEHKRLCVSDRLEECAENEAGNIFFRHVMSPVE